MGGAIGAISGIVQQLAPLASLIPGADVIMAAVKVATAAAEKLQQAAKSATGSEKAMLDGKLADLAKETTGNLGKLGDLAANAAAGGLPQAAQVTSLVQKGIGALTQGAG